MKLMRTSILRPSQAAAPKQRIVYQFKITLLGIEPPIWRRIRVPDGTLDELHEHIQTAMGWTNSHLHEFIIGGRRYGDPELLDAGGCERDFLDSTKSRLRELVSKERNAFRFFYLYDFGDNWGHEIIYEGLSPVEPGGQYPRCVEGARTCPPDDCGGAGGYEDFLKAIRDPKNEDHEDMLELIFGKFDPEKFNPATATKNMIRGLADWREDN
jgi:hypothetical protein